jgi:hypothetical protein
MTTNNHFVFLLKTSQTETSLNANNHNRCSSQYFAIAYHILPSLKFLNKLAPISRLFVFKLF